MLWMPIIVWPDCIRTEILIRSKIRSLDLSCPVCTCKLVHWETRGGEPHFAVNRTKLHTVITKADKLSFV